MSDKKLGKLAPKKIAFVGGMVSIILIVPIELVILGDNSPSSLLAVSFAPFIEEILKVSGLLYLALKYPYTLETKRDAIILGGLAGLGYGLIESFFYIISGEYSLIGIIIVRSISTIGHVFSSGVVAYGIVFLANKNIDPPNILTLFKNIRSSDVLSFLIIAILMHLQYNILIFVLSILGIIIGTLIEAIIFYKIYCYIPDDMEIPIGGPFKLLSEALHTKKRKSINDIISEIIRTAS